MGSSFLSEHTDGSFTVHIPEGVALDRAVIIDGTESGGRIQIAADDDVCATVFLDLQSSQHAIDVAAGRNAVLTVVSLQSGDSSVSVTQRGRIAEGGTLHWINITLGASVEQDLVSESMEPNATSDIDWVSFVRDKEHQKLFAKNVFTAPRGGGEITMRGIAQNSGHAQCSGMIVIGEGGAGTDTYLTQDVLMLDPTAKVDAVPGLEIKTNDVKASHSATVARITQEDLFYFAARGIEETVARPMFVEGFLGELIGKITDAEVRGVVEEAVRCKLLSY